MEGYNQKNKTRKTTLVLEYLEFVSQRTAQPVPFSMGLLKNTEDEICCPELDVHTLNQAGQPIVLPPKSFWSLHDIKLPLRSVNKLL